MRSKDLRGILIAIAMLLMATLPLLAIDTSAEDVWAPPPITGHITADENWTGVFWTQNVVIDEGVTVTVDADSTWLVDYQTFIFVEGTLFVNGTETLPVTIEEFNTGHGWNTIQTNSTGTLKMENFTCEDSTRPITIKGQPSIIKKGGFTMAAGEAIFLDSPGGHLIENVRISGGNRGIFVFDNEEKASDFNGISTVGSEIGFYSYNGTDLNIRRSSFGNGLVGIVVSNSLNVQIEDVHVSRTAYLANTFGIISDNLVSLEWTRGTVDYVEFGVFFESSPGTEVVFKEVDILGNVRIGVAADSSSDEFEADFIECEFTATTNAVYLDAPTNAQHVDFMNTTWSGGSVYAGHGAEINVSWYLEMNVVDGSMEPIDYNVKVYNGTDVLLQDEDITGGHGKVLVQSLHYTDAVGRKVPTTVKITSSEGSGTTDMFHEDTWFDGYTYVDFMMDLWPTTTFPAEIELMEDVPKTYDLDDYFTDHEGQDLEYDLTPGVNLQATLSGSEMTVINAGLNWFGETLLEIEASDGGNETRVHVTIDILPVNDAPFFLIDPPYFEIEEEGTGYFNFTEYVFEAEDEDITWTIPETQGLDLVWDEENLNLTFAGIQDWFGLAVIEVNMTDGEDWTLVPIEVNVTPVNDPPVWTLMLSNGTEAPMVEYVYNETTNWTVYLIETQEDIPVEFWINASDVETEELLYSFVGEDLIHGAIEVEMYQIEVIVNETSNETEMQNVTVPMNFTYAPLMNDHMGDVVMFNVTDSEETVSYKVWFKVASVNDAPVFNAPLEWNVTAQIDVLYTIDIGEWISDAESDVLTISTSSDFVAVNGTVLEVLYNDTFTEDLQNVTVTISDGAGDSTAILTVYLDHSIIADDDDDDDDEPTIGTPTVTSDKESWTIVIPGDEGMTLFFVIEDEEGNRASYDLVYDNGKYTATIPKDDTEQGLDYWISENEDGDPITTDLTGKMPALQKDEEDDEFPMWIIILLILVVIFLIVAILLVVMRKGGEDYEE